MDIRDAAHIIEKRHPHASNYSLEKCTDWQFDENGLGARATIYYHGLVAWDIAPDCDSFVLAAIRASDRMDDMIKKREAKET